MIRKLAMLAVAALVMVALSAPALFAAPLPDNCTKDQGQVTCTTFEGPGNNQAGVGETTNTETQGNTTNKSPAEQQDLQDTQSCNPSSSKGKPCNP